MSEQRVRPAPAVREPILNLPTIIIVLIAICVAVQLVQSYVLTPEQDNAFLIATAFIPMRYSGQYMIDIYAFTTPITYAFLHGGFAHLAVNMVWLAAVGTPLANRIGWVRFLLFWLVCGAAAAGLHYLVHSTEYVPLVGASGAIAGMMAATARYMFRVNRFSSAPAYAGPLLPLFISLRSPPVLVFIVIWMGGNLLVGLLGAPGVSGSIAWEAHIGGFLAGFLLLGLFDRPVERQLPST
ncbi:MULTISPECIES: rhomboid family intramembrane serine protease [Mesorhizobium]|uniref:Rhomboid family intramembrane serine protease n=1 Tax=Mesorhizobium denitrificans TaxID=2294114 RepID=A0A371X6H9_9HYPH|nr:MULTISPECIES: rhomboid family intramembrane serine protease [Mesorhizobium]RFC64842.1 rhomboid family intramembrane serine protease [Mesorhizobium denitrificans]